MPGSSQHSRRSPTVMAPAPDGRRRTASWRARRTRRSRPGPAGARTGPAGGRPGLRVTSCTRRGWGASTQDVPARRVMEPPSSNGATNQPRTRVAATTPTTAELRTPNAQQKRPRRTAARVRRVLAGMEQVHLVVQRREHRGEAGRRISEQSRSYACRPVRFGPKASARHLPAQRRSRPASVKAGGAAFVRSRRHYVSDARSGDSAGDRGEGAGSRLGRPSRLPPGPGGSAARGPTEGAFRRHEATTRAHHWD